MSNTLPALVIPTSHPKNPTASSNISLPPLSSWSDGRRALSSLSSSPPSSSSPPMTPSSSRNHTNAYIRSSPALGSEITHYPSSDYIDELPSPWDRSHIHPTVKQPDASVSLPVFKSFFTDTAPIIHSTRISASQTSSEQIYGHRHNDLSGQPARYMPVFCDSEEEEQEDDSEGYSFVEEDARATFFRTSAERGQWKYDPIPLKTSRSLLRQSAPTSSVSPIMGLQLLLRTISEPAPSSGRASTLPATRENSHEEVDNRPEVPLTSYEDTMSSDQFSPTTDDAPCSLPSLTSDRESTEPEDAHYPSSPLPPSSPPLSSAPCSPMMRSISPLSFAPSSPLSYADSLPPDDDQDMDLQTDDEADAIPTSLPQSTETLDIQAPVVSVLAPTTEVRQDAAEGESMPISSVVIPRSPSPALEPTLPTEVPDANFADGQPTTEEMSPIPILSSAPEEDISISEKPADAAAMTTEGEHMSVQLAGDACDGEVVGMPVMEEMEVEVEDVVMPESLVTGESPVRDVEVEALKLKDENYVMDAKGEGSSTSKASASKEKRKQEDGQRDGPARKKSRVLSENSGSGSKKGSDSEKKGKSRKESKRRLEEEEEETAEEENQHVAPAPKTKKQKKNDGEAPPKRSRPHQISSRSKSTSSAAASSSKLPPNNASKPKPKPALKDPETQALDAEICGMLIESMATSRASCLPASMLYKSVMECRPSLKAQRSEREWMEIFERVLNDGEASRGSGVFGKVESSFKDDLNRPLEAQWFYVPELDEDQERAMLIRSMMPRPGKRSETKKYKQYYYRPLDKISRWDPEDEI